MLPQRNMQRLGLRMAKQVRSTPARNVVQRRFNSTENKPDWLVDNKFNRERENVKHHAASTSSMFLQLRRLSVFDLSGSKWSIANTIAAALWLRLSILYVPDRYRMTLLLLG
jgi:translation elongation factor EF-1alpha